jgi:hypothetical protein
MHLERWKEKKVKNKIHQILAPKQMSEFGGRTFSPGPGHRLGLKGETFSPGSWLEPGLGGD